MSRDEIDNAEQPAWKLSFIEQEHALDSPNRLCVSISDTHFTDNTVGIQSLGREIWQSFFEHLEELCRTHAIRDCYLIIDGDVVDFIRSGRWAEAGVYPWDRDHSDYPRILEKVARGIFDHHRQFFKLLRELPRRLRERAGVERVRVIPLLGNHDKEVLTVPLVLEMFYQEVLGTAPGEIDSEYRRWVGEMYHDDPQHFAAGDSLPWLPFYFADRGFRFFTTHGHWRDPYNSRAVPAKDGRPGWKKTDGWRPDRWQQLDYAPFILPCFGDSVAAGLLSGFIHDVTGVLHRAGINNPRLNRILSELDLYRPTYLGLQRVMVEASRLKHTGIEADSKAGAIIEETVYQWVDLWLSWSFPRQSASWSLAGMLAAGRWVIWLTRRLGLERFCIRLLMHWLHKIENRQVKRQSTEALDVIKTFPAFLPQYRHYGFQTHGEGHTHQPLQEEPNLDGQHNHTYVNLGSWRDRIVPRRDQGYRRRSVLRAFYILDLKPRDGEANRSIYYYTKDKILWGDHLDHIDEGKEPLGPEVRQAF